MIDRRTSYCRTCINSCPVVVTVEDGRAVELAGDPENDVYHGYSCTKGRAQITRLRSRDRLLRPLKRVGDRFVELSVDLALDEIAERLATIRDEYGADAIAAYFGTYMVTNATAYPVGNAFMQALGSTMKFSPNTIDKPGKNIAPVMLGGWQAPAQGFDNPSVALLIGINPLVSYTGLPFGHPRWLGSALESGMQLIVIDPRRCDVAKRATLFLQPRPGHDAVILASMIRCILVEDLLDHAFVDGDVRGVDALRAAVLPFTPELVGRLADIEPSALESAARMYAGAARGYAIAGTGPSMSGPGTLVEYLVLVLQTLCGRWLRAGEIVRNAPVLMPAPAFRAQASAPRPSRDYTRPMRVRGLTATAAGLPVAAVADEILLRGPGQIRALISVGGNPVGAWPNQEKVIKAMRELDLLVQVDPWMSATSRLAHYIIPPLMALEVASITHVIDGVSNRTAGYGSQDSYGQYTPAIVAAPEGSDLLDDWQVFFGLAVRLGLALTLSPVYEGGGMAADPVALPMKSQPSTDELLELIATGSRVPLDDVRKRPHGSTFPLPQVVVLPKADGWPHRLEVANPEMMAALGDELGRLSRRSNNEKAAFRLLCRRSAGLHNTTVNDGLSTKGRTHNPAYMNPIDMVGLGLLAGDEVEIRSGHGTIAAVVDQDDTLRRGLISMSHGFGSLPGLDDDPRVFGSNVSRLIPDDVDYDAWSGQPRMSDIPVDVMVRPCRSVSTLEPNDLSSSE